MSLHSDFSGPSLAIREDLARRYLSLWIEARGEAQRAFERVDALHQAGADRRTIDEAVEAGNAAYNQQSVLEARIARVVLDILGRPVPAEGDGAALAVDGWIFVVGAGGSGKADCVCVIPPCNVLGPAERSSSERLFHPSPAILAN